MNRLHFKKMGRHFNRVVEKVEEEIKDEVVEPVHDRLHRFHRGRMHVAREVENVVEEVENVVEEVENVIEESAVINTIEEFVASPDVLIEEIYDDVNSPMPVTELPINDVIEMAKQEVLDKLESIEELAADELDELVEEEPCEPVEPIKKKRGRKKKDN